MKLVDVDFEKVYALEHDSSVWFKFIKAKDPGWLRGHCQISINKTFCVCIKTFFTEYEGTLPIVRERGGDGLWTCAGIVEITQKHIDRKIASAKRDVLTAQTNLQNAIHEVERSQAFLNKILALKQH